MTFTTIQYIAFFAAVVAVYWRLSHRPQTLLLLVASYVFYAAWDWRFLGLMWLTTITDFVVGLLLERTPDGSRRKRLFALSVALNLSVLAFFKYFDFFVDSAGDLLGTMGFQVNEPTLEILLPVGISFYTFHGISYTFDVYRRHIRPTGSLLTFAAFVAFFPQLVAGPIGRAEVQLPQMANPRTRPDVDTVASGLFLILLGFVKKLVIADSIAPYVDRMFGGAAEQSAANLLIGAYAFALQIYGDFSGYTDIARGSSRLLGVELLVNFRQPYLSRSITEFWRTWHISLSTWLRDYLYVPLGGNRGGRWRTVRNLMLTMLLGGLWHGASWTFVAWGAIHGALLSGERLAGRHRAAAADAERVRGRDLLPILVTFHVVCLAWIFFRAESFAQAFDYLTGLVTLRGGTLNTTALAAVALAGAVALAIDVAQRNTRSEAMVLRLPHVPRGLAIGGLALTVIVFSGQVGVPFIYFQF